jgi:maltose/moltooligosaccharide transporter
MGILNMMIVVPMLVQTVTFGWIFNHLLDNKGSNAITLAGVLLGIGAVAMLWVNPPDEADESPIVPLGSHRSISVYDRVVVGSDGTATSLYAVDRAAEVAQAAHARLVVVTAYRDADPATAPAPAAGMHRDIYGVDAARAAMGKSVTELTRERARYIEQQLVAGDPAQALLDTIGSNPANLIVVGNRGLGANEGQLLGSVPGCRREERRVRRARRADVGTGRRPAARRPPVQEGAGRSCRRRLWCGPRTGLRRSITNGVTAIRDVAGGFRCRQTRRIPRRLIGGSGVS